MTTTVTDDLEIQARWLEASGNYRVLRKLQPIISPVELRPTDRVGILVDFETTGLDTGADEIIEIGMVKFVYGSDNRIVGATAVFSSLHQPSNPIPQEITDLTGITNEMVAGHKIDDAAVEAFASDANLLVAHNAKFDRKFAERYWHAFSHKPWACSASQVNWRRRGFAGSRLEYLLNGIGHFHSAHRAVDDCHALLSVLAHGAEKTAFGELLDQARRNTVRVWAQGAPFDLKDVLKKRKYRWNDGSDGRPKSWHIDIDEELRDDELQFLRAEIYRRECDIYTQTLTAIDRFSTRG